MVLVQGETEGWQTVEVAYEYTVVCTFIQQNLSLYIGSGHPAVYKVH